MLSANRVVWCPLAIATGGVHDTDQKDFLTWFALSSILVGWQFFTTLLVFQLHCACRCPHDESGQSRAPTEMFQQRVFVVGNDTLGRTPISFIIWFAWCSCVLILWTEYKPFFTMCWTHRIRTSR